MPELREYLFSITAAALLCAIAKHMVGQKKNTGKLIYIITGLFLTVTMISPVTDIRIGNLEEYIEDLYTDGQSISEKGKSMAYQEMEHIIKEQTQAYILNEAERLGTHIDVEVTLSDSYPPEPKQVTMTGSVSPYQKKCISQYLAQYMGIPQERQIWN